MKFLLPLLALIAGFGGMTLIEVSASQEETKDIVDTRPTVTIEAAHAEDYQVVIVNYGEVQPLERTMISAQVSGEVVSWHPSFVAGGLVLRDSVLFSIEKDTYEAALLQAQANVSLAQSQLIEEKARADVAAQEAKSLPSSKVSDLYLRKPQLLSAQANLKSAQAGLKIAQRDLDNCEVLAPYDALVVSRNIGVGQFIAQGTSVGEIYSVEAAEIIFPVAGFDSEFLPDDLAEKEAKVTTNGYDKIERTGLISRDLGVVDQATRMSQLVVRVNDPYSLKSNMPALKFGNYVQVSFSGRTLEHIYRLPQALVNNQTVWIVDKDNRLQPRKVEILREEGEFLLISKGISDKDSIVTTLPEYPQTGMEVKVSNEKSNSELTAHTVK
jgi:RND family efflux transporter MFP subunit